VATTTFRSELDGSHARRGLGAVWHVCLQVLVALMACFLVHCSRCETETLPAPSASAVAPEPPAAPRRLLAEFVVPRPGAVWSVARDLAAAYSPVLPREGALALAHGLGLPVTAAGLFELTAPITGVLTLDAQGQVVPTFAIPVKSGRE